MKMFEGFSDWMKQAAAGAAFIPATASSAQTQNPVTPPTEEIQGDIYRDLRALTDKIDNKKYPWEKIQERKADIDSEINKKFIDKLKKLYEKADKDYDKKEIGNLVSKILDLDIGLEQKRILTIELRRLQSSNLPESKQKILWLMAELVIDKTKKR